MTKLDAERRNLLKNNGLVGICLICSGLAISSLANAAASIKTPAQAEGPFYPVIGQQDKDADMTIVRGREGTALGTEVFLSGSLYDADTSLPIAGAVVEFWQADAQGTYNHPEDLGNARRDPYFQYWAQVQTDHQGKFRLKTIRPGYHPADTSWMRPSHIHVKVHKAGYPLLTTQIYFKGDQYNDSDQILQKLTPEQQSLVIIDFKEIYNPYALFGEWNIFIGKFKGMTRSSANRLTTPELD